MCWMCDMVRILTTAFEKGNKGFEMRIETPLINYADSEHRLYGY